MGWFYGFKPYVSVAKRQANAAREVAKLARKGRTVSPVKIEGRAIATTFWGKAWCDNLESYSDFENRLPRGRTYVRNGSVCDLQIMAGRVTALVCGSELYRIEIKIKPLPRATWEDVKARCAGQIASLVELLQGRLSRGVMEVVTGREGGLFPKPKEIEMKCSCPDWAGVCKHVAAALYGVGSRLDAQPELLFALRGVDHLELIARAGDPVDIARPARSARGTIAAGDLADVFGIELDGSAPPGAAAGGVKPAPEPPARRARHKPLPETTKRSRAAARPERRNAGAPAGRATAPTGRASAASGKASPVANVANVAPGGKRSAKGKSAARREPVGG